MEIVNKGTLFSYQKARQRAMELEEKSEVAIRAIAAEHKLSEAFTKILVAVTTLWKVDNEGFSTVLEAVYADAQNTPEERALAAENASSRYFFDGATLQGLEWSWRSAELTPFCRDANDVVLLKAKLDFGVWDNTSVEPTLEAVRAALDTLIRLGSYDAPGRVKASLDRFDAAEQIRWLERVTQLSPQDTAANVYYLNWCRRALADRAGA